MGNRKCSSTCIFSSRQSRIHSGIQAESICPVRRRFTLVQGPPGTGKTTTAVAIICGWLKSNRGPVLASAFSNKGCDNVAQQLHALGVKVLRMGLCSAKEPYSLETRLQECGLRRGDKGMKAVFENVDVICATCIGCGMGCLDDIFGLQY